MELICFKKIWCGGKCTFYD